MTLKLVDSGKRIVKLTGVRSIMADIQKAMEGGTAKIINLGAGNPVAIKGMSEVWERQYKALMTQTELFMNCMGRYNQTRGLPMLLDAICEYFSENFGLSLSRNNVLVSPGSQSIYFYAANLFTGRLAGEPRHLLLPNLPDYTGYGGVGMSDVPIIGCMPTIEQKSQHTFKYQLNLDSVDSDLCQSVGATFLSSPCNPTGRIISEEELLILHHKLQGSPLFVDNAYGNPFPSVCFSEVNPVFKPGIVNTFSLSKVGFPGERVGIAIGSEDVIGELCAMQSNACIHGALLGQALAAMAINAEDLRAASVAYIRSYYQKMHALAAQLFSHYLADHDYFLHEVEGGMFTWLWLPTLKASDLEVYEAAKQKGVFVVPGSVFFSGVDRNDAHIHQCFRISLTCTESELESGIKLLSKVIIDILDSDRGTII